MLGALALQSPPAASSDPRTPVLVELFTSQGCLSCPPADELLITLDELQPVPGALIVPLGQHVEYWNGQWRDPFSSPLFTERQLAYRKSLRTPALYTPQMVVDGRIQLVGSHGANAHAAITAASHDPKARISVAVLDTNSYGSATVAVTVTDIPGLTPSEPADLWVALTEEGLTTDVQRGENAFRRLRNATLVRDLRRVDRLPLPTPPTFTIQVRLELSAGWVTSRFRVVAFVQARESRRVLGVGQRRFD